MHVLVDYWLYSQKQIQKILDWLVLKNVHANLIRPWVADSTQLGSAGPLYNKLMKAVIVAKLQCLQIIELIHV